MAWSVLQSASLGANAPLSLSVAYPRNVVVDTCLIAAIATGQTDTNDPVSVLDNNGNALTKKGSVGVSVLAPLNVSLWAMTTPSADAGTRPTLTATFDTNQTVAAMLIQEVAGIQSGIDGTMGSSTGAAAPPASPSYTSTSSGEYLVAVIGDNFGGAFFGAPAGYTLDPNSTNDVSTCDIAIAYRNSTRGAESATFSGSPSLDCAELLGAFTVLSGALSPDQWTVYPASTRWLAGQATGSL